MSEIKPRNGALRLKGDEAMLAKKAKKKAKKEKKRPGERLRGFERRLDPERIVGATDSSGELMFLIKVILKNEYIQYTQKTFSKKMIKLILCKRIFVSHT